MTDHRQPFGQSTIGVVVIQGVIGPLVGVAATLLLTNGRDIPWGKVGAIAAAVAVGLFVILSFTLPGLRRIIWGWLNRWGWRPLSTANKRHVEIDLAVEAAKKDALKAGRNAGFKDAAAKLKPVVESLSAKAKEAEADRDMLKERLDAALETTKQNGQGLERLTPDLPPLSPRWALVPLEVEPEEHGPRYRRFKLVNMVEDSVAYNVRVESSDKRFRHTDGAAWKDMSGRTERNFGGQLNDKGAFEGFKLTVWWSEGEADSTYYPREEFLFASSEDVWGQPLTDDPF